MWKKVGVDMEIEVGEYVRTYDGFIGQVIEINKENLNYYTINCKRKVRRDGMYNPNHIFSRDEFIVKHSKNIIDLIEKGDYVNGRLVLQVDYKYKNVCLLIPFTDTQANTNICWYGNEDIKSVVTKEQFKSVEYEVE